MSQRCIVAAALVSTILAARLASAQSNTDSGRDIDQMVGHSATGLALPNAPIDAPLELTAARASSWREGDTDAMLLEGGVDAAIGDYFFHADYAVAFIRPLKVNGVDARQIALYLDNVR